MRLETLIVAIALTACADPGPGSNPNTPATGTPYLTGQTGQSGTMGLTCGELAASEPQPNPVGPDEPTPLGFTPMEALTAMEHASSTLTWEADGTTEALTSELWIEEHGVNANFDAATNTLTACVGLTLRATDSGWIRGFTAQRIPITAVGETHIQYEGYEDEAWVGDPDTRLQRYDVQISGTSTTGTYEEQDPNAAVPSFELVVSW